MGWLQEAVEILKLTGDLVRLKVCRYLRGLQFQQLQDGAIHRQQGQDLSQGQGQDLSQGQGQGQEAFCSLATPDFVQVKEGGEQK